VGLPRWAKAGRFPPSIHSLFGETCTSVGVEQNRWGDQVEQTFTLEARMIVRAIVVSMALSFTLVFASPASSAELSQDEAYTIAKDAYVYAYPFMIEYVTVRQAANYVEPTGIIAQAPVNQFSHARQFPPADFKAVVRPNADTLYSVANLDLGPEPLVLSIPATDRYFMMPMLSLWSDVFAVPGTRTTGRNTARDFLVVGPHWSGDIPAGLEVIRSPTRFVGIGGRTQTNGANDYDNVHKIQAGYKLTPLSAWGKGDYVAPKGKVDPSIDMKTPPPVQVERMDAETYFGLFATLLKDNPPGPLDYPMVHRLERTGFKVGEAFNLASASPAIRQAFERATKDGNALVAQLGKQAAGEGSKGWTYNTRSADFGVDYRYRAAVASYGFGMNLPQDAIYPSLSNDADGKPLDGNFKYILHFNKSELPPVEGFWSLTAYDLDGYFIPNALNRQAVGDRSNLVSNSDGSVDLYIQADSPGGSKEANWLPVGKAPFTLMIRLYSPKEEVVDRSWTPPPVSKVK
jgi:hypothetical protein